MTPLTLGAWNVCILMDYGGAHRPEWRTALIAEQLARYKVDIAVLSETQLAEEGQLSEIGAGYTFFWIGYSRHVHHDAVDGFAMKSNLVNKLAGPP